MVDTPRGHHRARKALARVTMFTGRELLVGLDLQLHVELLEIVALLIEIGVGQRMLLEPGGGQA